MAGPIRVPPHWAAPLSALAWWSVSGLVTWGMSPVMAGVKNAVPTPTVNSRTTNPQIGGRPVSSHAARPAWATQRSRSEPSITARRLNRSAMTPANSRNSASGNTSAASTQPTSEVDPPRPSTANVSATGSMPVPMNEVARPTK